MILPINVNDLVNGLTVECERKEFKESWNPQSTLPTICAFANDFRNLGGGYILIGIAENNGRPILPPKGLLPDEADKIQKDLLHLCKQRITPEYTPFVEPVVCHGKLILAVWCPGGQDRPYEVPDSLTKGAGRHYFIRKLNSTVRPTKSEKEELLRFSAIPFDDRLNHWHQLRDLSPTLVRDFLREVKSKLFEESDRIPFLDLCRQMNLVEGPDEYIRPKNFALMFFSDHPERIFPMAQIQIVHFDTNSAADGYKEKTCTGPLSHQLKEALSYLRTAVVMERVIKVRHQAEAIRFFNFPYEALEEALANAVYHRNYEIREPIEVRIHPDSIHIISFPGPDHCIDMEDFETGKVRTRRYRNRQIGNLLKQLKLTEGMGTGITTIKKEMEKNGSPKPIFQTDSHRESFMVTLLVHADFPGNRRFPDEYDPAIVKESAMPYLAHAAVAEELLKICSEGLVSRSELMKRLHLSEKTEILRHLLLQLTQCGALERAMPEKPDVPWQEYTTTAAGVEYLNRARMSVIR